MPRLPLILQLSDTECGIAALAMLMHYYRVCVPLEVLREKCGVSRDGCKLSVLLAVATEYGFQAEAYTVERLDKKTLPCIAYWEFKHYVVIKKIKRNTVVLHDPNLGKIKLSHADFYRGFTGVVLLMRPKRNSKRIHHPAVRDPLRVDQGQGFLFLGVVTLVLALTPYFQMLLTHSFAKGLGILKELNGFYAILILLTLVTFIANQLMHKMEFKVRIQQGHQKAKVCIWHMLHLPLRFYSLRSKSELTAMLQRMDIGFDLIFKGKLNQLTSLMLLTGNVVALYYLSWQLTCILVIVMLVTFALLQILSRKVTELEKSNLVRDSLWYAHTLTSLKNLATIKACGLEVEQYEKSQQLLTEKRYADMHKMQAQLGLQSVFKLEEIFLQASVIFYGGYLVTQEKLSAAQLLVLFILTKLFYFQWIKYIEARRAEQQGEVMIARIRDVSLCLPDARYNLHEANVIPESELAFEVKDIDFAYSKHSQLVLKQISFSVRQGEHIAIVGKSGSGKSTLAQLLLGLHRPDCGSILLQGGDIQTISPQQLAATLSYVSQECHLLENNWQKHLELLVAENSFTSIQPLFAKLGLEHLLQNQDQTIRLSGGEIQRIEIARALLQNTPIILLDEATSALDGETTNSIISLLKSSNKTVVWITHAIETIQHCDQIIVLKDGRLIQSGLHDARGY